MGQIKHNWENKKDLLTQEKHVNYCYYLVPGVGIEPTQRQAPRDFKSLASTSSATQAHVNYTKSCAVYSMFALVCQGFDQLPVFPETNDFLFLEATLCFMISKTMFSKGFSNAKH